MAPMRTCEAGPAGPWLAALLACAAGAQARACEALVPGLDTGALRSHWEEFDAQGRSLVREQGRLRRSALTLALPCGPATWSAQWAWSQGDRAYDGVSNTGVPVATHSAIDGSDFLLQALLAIDAHWSWGLRLSHSQLRRDIAGTGAVLGYAERFSYWQAALGLGHQRPLTPDTTLSAALWLGGGPGGRLSVHLPRADPAVLDLGRSRLVHLGLQIGSAARPESRPGWSWQLGLHYEEQRMGAGPALALTRNGLATGAALQPRTVQRAHGITLGLRYRF